MTPSGAVPDALWRLLLASAAARRGGALPAAPCGLRLGADDELEGLDADDERATLRREAGGAFLAGPALGDAERELVELYLPLLGGVGHGSTVVAHLGQSADARIASASGDSRAVTGRADFVHMHRLRALSDAVLVGAGTVAADDPRLTVRLVEGSSPLRVVLDPGGRLGDGFGVFRDGGPPTLRVRMATDRNDARPTAGERSTGASQARDRAEAAPSGTETLEVPEVDGELSLDALLEALRARNAQVVFVEGGGVTVARWMTSGRLDRLHLVASPLLIGEARAALPLPAAATMDDAWRPAYRLYRLGRDILWDFDLRARAPDDDAERDGAPVPLLRPTLSAGPENTE